MRSPPLVTVMIATRDRTPELRLTLQLLRKQRYESVDLLIIDDGSRMPVAPVVQKLWPEATVIRHEENKGQCERRNEGFAVSRGEFILHLDDDCCLTKPEDLATAVACLVERPDAAAVVFELYNGPALPESLQSSTAGAGCVRSFIGAAILFRTTAIRQTLGYRSFYQAQGEEDELALQLLSLGWQILYCPKILAHHRLSSLNRNNLATWSRGFGNEIWTVFLHMPLRRLPIEVGWKVLVGAWDAIRMRRFVTFWQAIWRCAKGVRGTWRLREPLSSLALRRYDALRARGALTKEEFTNPPAVRLADLRRWWTRWRNRARDASIWESPGGRGSSVIVRYAHEFPENDPHGSD